MSKKDDLTADYVRSILHYDPETGIFTWKARPREHFTTQRSWAIWNARFPGSQAGVVNVCLRISIDGVIYRAHRLAWLYMTGEWPTGLVDHADCCTLNNSFVNLREATHAENQRNRRTQSNNSSGYKGVSWDTRLGKWRAQIGLEHAMRHLGVFENVEDAAAAYAKAARELHGEFARTA